MDEQVTGVLHGQWKWAIAFAILLIIMGFLAIANPLATVLATSIVLGVSLLFSGGFSLVLGLAGKGVSGRWVEIMFGILSIIGGIMVLRSPIEGAVALVWVLGSLYAVTGMFEIAAAFRVSQNRGWLIFLGIVDVFLGFWIMFMLPGTALLTLAFIVGLGLLIRGFTLFWLSLRLRKIAG